MVAVIADDFTGAAEIGGVAIRNGFSAKIYTELPEKCTSEVLIIATNTRALNPAEAIAIIKKITSDLLKFRPEFIYKKTDSLLRGNVEEELLAQMKASNKPRSLLIPANPSLKRTIKNGTYFINEKPIAESQSFSNNLQKSSSAVLDLLDYKNKTKLFSQEQQCQKGIFVGNTPNTEALEEWVKKVNQDTIPAGGADFFNALLKKRKPGKPFHKKPEKPVGKSLYICGSKFQDSIDRVSKAHSEKNCVAYIPENYFCAENKNAQKEWRTAITEIFKSKNSAIAAIDQLECSPDDLPLKIEKAFAELVYYLLEELTLSHIYIEGGATAFAIIQKIKTTSFTPVQEIDRGVIKLQIESPQELILTLKPGSYNWPDKIWPF